MTNPYHAPASSLDDDTPPADAYQPDALSLSGRIGRVRFICYSFWLTAAAFVAFSFAAVPFNTGAGRNQLIGILGMGVLFAVNAIYTRRRLHDLNLSGWLTLLSLVPFLNILMWFGMAIAPGNAQANRFGPPPAKNGWPPIVGAVLVPVVMVGLIGLMAAVAMPAYNNYVAKARAERASQEAERAREVDAVPEASPTRQP